MKTQTHKATNETKVPVSTRALVARLRRSLAKDDLILHKSRSAMSLQECGEWYVTDERGGYHEFDIDIEGYAKARDLIRPYEVIRD